jgi:hypothetical protein
LVEKTDQDILLSEDEDFLRKQPFSTAIATKEAANFPTSIKNYSAARKQYLTKENKMSRLQFVRRYLNHNEL